MLTRGCESAEPSHRLIMLSFMAVDRSFFQPLIETSSSTFKDIPDLNLRQSPRSTIAARSTLALAIEQCPLMGGRGGSVFAT